MGVRGGVCYNAYTERGEREGRMISSLLDKEKGRRDQRQKRPESGDKGPEIGKRGEMVWRRGRGEETYGGEGERGWSYMSRAR